MSSESEPSVTSDFKDYQSIGMMLEESEQTRFRRYALQANDEQFSSIIQQKKSEEIVNLLGIQNDKQQRTAEILESMSVECRGKTIRQLLRVESLKIESKLSAVNNKLQVKIVREGFTVIPDVQWEDVGGLCDLKEEVELRICQRIMNPDQFEAFGIDQSGILLHGPPGCGKTMLIQALVNKLGYTASFIHVEGPEVLKDTSADGVKAIRDIFTRARMHPPCILFFDNMDAYSRAMPEGNIIVSQLKCELNNDENRGKVHVLGATNRFDLVDSTLLTYERFGTKFLVSLPDPVERRLILEALAAKKCVDSSISFSDIAIKKSCENFSGADLNMLMNEAAMAATQDKSAIITISHFDEAMSKVFPSAMKFRMQNLSYSIFS